MCLLLVRTCLVLPDSYEFQSVCNLARAGYFTIYKLTGVQFCYCLFLYLTEIFKRAKNTFGQIDIAVGNAGIIDEIQWEACINVNLVSRLLVRNVMKKISSVNRMVKNKLSFVILITGSINTL